MKHRALAFLLAAVAITGCAGNRPPSGEPTPPPKIDIAAVEKIAVGVIEIFCPAVSDPLPIVRNCVTSPFLRTGKAPTAKEIKDCVLREAGCLSEVIGTPYPPAPPTGAPTATSTIPPASTSTAAPSATAVPAPAGTPTPYVVPKVPTTCTSVEDAPLTPSFAKEVRQAIAMYRAANPSDFEGNHILFPGWWDDFYFGVVANLKLIGLEAVVDDCGGAGLCGEIAVAAKGTKQGKGKNDQYNILTSGGDVRDPLNGAGFRATCDPKWF